MNYDSADPEGRLPRLGIRHVMLWTLFTAGYLALFHRLGDAAAQSDGVRMWMSAQLILVAMLAGASLTEVVPLAYARVRPAAPLHMEPGHWLLMADAATLLLYKPMDVAIELFFEWDVEIGIALMNWSWA